MPPTAEGPGRSAAAGRAGQPVGSHRPDGRDRDPRLAGGVSSRWLAWRAATDLDEYDQRWDRRAAAGAAVHGEADAVERLVGGRRVRVLDAGCGMGRVAIELARRGHDAVGVDADADLLDRARSRAPHLRWVHADLSTARLDGPFDVAIMAGGVIEFVDSARRSAAVTNTARSLAPGGLLVAGFGLGGDVTLGAWRRWCSGGGLVPQERWSTWEGAPGPAEDDPAGYVVEVARRPSPTAR